MPSIQIVAMKMSRSPVQNTAVYVKVIFTLKILSMILIQDRKERIILYRFCLMKTCFKLQILASTWRSFVSLYQLSPVVKSLMSNLNAPSVVVHVVKVHYYVDFYMLV